MSEFSGITWPVILGFVNLIFSSAIVITAFSLLGYVLTHNLRSTVAQSFSVLLACVLVVFVGDIVIPRATTVHAADIWLRDGDMVVVPESHWLGAGDWLDNLIMRHVRTLPPASTRTFSVQQMSAL